MTRTIDGGRLGRWQVLCGAAAVLALMWSGYEAVALMRASRDLTTAASPRGRVSLPLASNPAEARAIVGEWTCAGGGECREVVSVARASLERDARFILAYGLGWSLATIWAAWVIRLPLRLWAIVLVLLAAGAVSDVAENWYLGVQLGNADRLPAASIMRWLTGAVGLSGLGSWNTSSPWRACPR